MSSLKSRAIAHRHHVAARPVKPRPDAVAHAYDHVGTEYVRYADGDAEADPSRLGASLAYADSVVWAEMKRAVDVLASGGERTLRVLDAGCGPGTWLRRIANYALLKGMAVQAIGTDISEGQLRIARANLEKTLEADVAFVKHDLADPLPWPDRQFNLVVCNYVVLNHLQPDVLPRAAAELCRVASDRVIASVRGLAGPPTACITSIGGARHVSYDEQRRELVIDLRDGTHHRFAFNMVTAARLDTLFGTHARILDLRAIDLFVTRFRPADHWTPHLTAALPGGGEVFDRLVKMEEETCRRAEWLDKGTHVLIVAGRR